jgi:16S rRNA processing protein RimM
MNQADCLEIGKIVKAHGLKGEVLLHLDTEDPGIYSELESVFVEIKQKLIPFFIEEFRLTNNKKAIVRFEDISDIKATESIINAKVFLPREMVEEMDGDKYFYESYIGFLLHDKELGEIGTIAEVYETPGNDLFGVLYQGEEVLIPINEDFILEMDEEKKIIYVALPGGLLELNKPGQTEEEDDKDED